MATAHQMQPVLESTEGPLIRMRNARSVEQQRDAALEKVLTPPQSQQRLAAKEEIKQKAEQGLLEKQKGGKP